MSLVWLPEDGWPDHLDLSPSLDVQVWRSGVAVPTSVGDVEFYVPEYLGPSSVLEVIETMPRLRVVQTLTAGYEDVLPYLSDRVALCNARGVHDDSTAELAVGLTIASLRGFPDFVRQQQSGRWVHARYQSLADKRVLIVGFGSVGQAIADRLEPFEVTVTGVARRARENIHGFESLDSLLPACEVVILALPLTPITRGLVDARFLSLLRDGTLVVNVSRGAVVDTGALIAELHSKRLHAALDVTDPEPLPPEHPLWQSPNVIISPHVGGDTSAFLPRAWRLLQGQLDRFANGEDLNNVISVGSPSAGWPARPDALRSGE